MDFDIDFSIVVGFLLVTLIVGFGHGREIKTIKDYALGGRNFSTGVLVATIVATWASGSGFFIILSKTYSDGLYYLVADASVMFSFFLTAFILVPRMQEFLGQTSIAETMGNLYGKNVRIITAVTGVISAIGFIAVQFKVFGSLFSYFLGFPGIVAIVMAGIIVTTYSAFGGIRAVTYTDVIQFCAFSLAIPMVGMLIWDQMYYDNVSVTHALETPKFNYREVISLGNPEFLAMIPLILYFSIPTLGPAAIQRISIGRNLEQVKKAFIIAGIVFTIINLIIAWIPFLLFNINPNLEPSQLGNYIIDNYSYIGLKGLMITAIIAFAMSTADSHINISSVLFSHDICAPLKIETSKKLFFSRIFPFLLGGFAILLALSEKDLLSIVLTANSFYMPIVTIPLILSILGFRSTTKSVLIGMGAGFTTVILWQVLDIQTDSIIFGMLANLIFLLGSHYLLKQDGGWIRIKNSKYLSDLKIKKKNRRKKILKLLSEFNFIAFCKKHFPTNELTYTGLGIYFIIYTFTTMYSTHVELLKENGRTILAIYQVMMVSGVVMAMYPMWPLSVKKEYKETFVQIWLPMAVFYMLAFFSTFFVMVSNFSHLQFVIFTVNIIIAAMLVGWRLATIMMVAGCYLGIEFYKFYKGIAFLDFSIGSPGSIFMYTLMMISIALVIFLKPKQEYLEATEKKVVYLEKEIDYARREFEDLAQGLEFLEDQFKDKEGKLKAKEIYLKDQLKLRNIEIAKLKDLKDEFIRNIPHEANTPLTGILSLSDVLYSCYDSLDKKIVKQSIKDIVNSSDRLKTYINNIADLSKLSALTYELNKEEVDLSELVRERPVLYKKIFTDDDKQKFIFKVEDKLMVQCDEYYITQAIDNLISNAVKYGKGKPITISLTKTVNNKVKFTITDEGIGIPKDELISIFHKFTTSSKTRTPAGGRGVGLALCEKVITVHGGTIEVQSNGEKGAEFSFVLPYR